MPDRRPRLSIPTRIFLGFALVLTAFGAVALTSLLQHERSARTLRLLHEGYLPLALTVGEAKATQAIFGTVLDRVLSERDPTATRNWLTAARRVRPAMLRRAYYGIERAEQLDPPAEDRVMLDEIRSILDRVRASHAQGDEAYGHLFDALEAGDDARAEEVLDELRALERDVQSDLRAARTVLQERIATMSAEAAEQERQSALLLGALALLSLAVGVAVLWWAHRMLAPLPRLQERVAAVARGNLSAKLEPRTDDELGRLAAEFERMVEALAARDVRLREAARAERRLQRMQEQIVTGLRAAVVVVDAEGTVRMVNPAAKPVLGLEATDVNRPLADSGLLDRLPPLGDAVHDVARGAERAVLTATPIASNGEERAVNVLVTPFGTDEPGAGAPRSTLVVAEDVTEELRTKWRLIQTERLAAIGRMAAHVTHEVRNPLSSIGLNVEMLADDLAEAGPEAQALLRAIQREIDRLTGITEEYLRLARLPQPRLEPDDPGAVIRSVSELVRAEMRESGIDLHVEVADDLPQVAMDEPQIRQALLNLLRNAREAMPEGGDVRIEADHHDGGVRVLVRDEGPGIPAEERRRIFDLFYTTKERGTGLGLPLTQQIVVAHGGRIRCESGADGGTTFELWLPAAGRATGVAAPPGRAMETAMDAGGRPNDAFED